ncbi:asparagine synthase-related protein [Haladaptatus halobius]|uniref:asparagine synthase-related protein n=1 Tax=Haladaptatus halobius TaxID=2884875 RepID=UPI001D0B240A|nr:asparagine synthase-related protein [Haladaptatus halobius]
MVGLFGAFGERRHGLEALPSTTWSEDERTATFSDERVAMANSFHPVLADDQPVRTTDGDALVWIQGDVYGFERGGSYSPRPTGLDAPTYCANLYEAYGVDFADGLNGQFAGVVYDRDARDVHLLTDRLGSYPLFHTTASGTLLCSTDVQSLPSHPGVETSFDLDYLAEYLAFKRSFGVTTPLSGVEKLPPGTVTTLDLDAMSTDTRSYWRPEYTPVDAPFRFFVDRFTDLFRRVLDEWVRDNLDYGLLLSGGSDSRLVMAAMPKPVVGFHMNDWPNREARTAKRVAAAAGNEFVFLRRDRDYRPRALERNAPLSNFDGWFTQAYPTGFADEITNSVDVLLSGLYSDTLFKGYSLSSPKVSLGPLGTVTLPLEDRIESVDEFVDRLAVETPSYLDGVELDRVLRENVTDEGDHVDHHGVRYRSLRELVVCSDYYPLSNDTELIYTNGLRQLRPYRTPFLDNRLVDLHLSMPVRYRLRRNVVNRAIERLSPRLAAVPHSGSGVSVDRSFPVEYVGRHLNALRRKFVDGEELPEPWFTHGPWSNDAELVRNHGFVADALAENRATVEKLPFLEWDGVKRCYGDHLDGEDNTVELYTLLTLLEMPVTERLRNRDESGNGETDGRRPPRSPPTPVTGSRGDAR